MRELGKLKFGVKVWVGDELKFGRKVMSGLWDEKSKMSTDRNGFSYELKNRTVSFIFLYIFYFCFISEMSLSRYRTYAQLMKMPTAYARRMNKLSNRIFTEVTRSTEKSHKVTTSCLLYFFLHFRIFY